MRVAITGLGCVTSLGGTADATFDALCAGAIGIGGPGPFPGRGPVAAIPGGPHLTSALALTAAREALAGFTSEDLAIVGGSTSGDMVRGEVEYARHLAGEPVGRELLWAQLCDRPAEIVARELGVRGPRLSVSSACTSGASAVGVAAGWVASGRSRAVLAFGADALCGMTVHGFGALGAVSATPARPFAEERDGLSLGEGAAALLLEDAGHARARGAEILGWVTGYGTAMDAWHMTAPHPEGRGARAAIRKALGDLPAGSVGYVNAHGTGTRLNDEMEAAVLRDELPAASVSSVKGALGHTLGAAGAIELVVTVLALRRGILPPSAGLGASLYDRVLREPERRAVDHAISVSFAFGGSNAAVRVSRC